MNASATALWKQPEIVAPSDNLKSLYALCDSHPFLNGILGMLPRIRLVIDTNIVLQELLFVTKARRLSTARTALREVMDCGSVVTIAPTKLQEEVNRHLPRLAEEEDVPLAKLLFAWLEFQARIEFHQTEQFAQIEQAVVDPDDLPFVTLYFKAKVDAVLTNDSDISRMGAETLNLKDLAHVRDYARAKSPEVTLRVGSLLITGVAIGGLVGLVKLIAAALRGFSKLSPGWQLAIIAGIVFAALNPTTRKMICDGANAIADHLKIPAVIFGDVFSELSLQIATAQLDVKKKQVPVENMIKRISPNKAILADSFDNLQEESPTRLTTEELLPSPAVRRRPRRSTFSLPSNVLEVNQIREFRSEVESDSNDHPARTKPRRRSTKVRKTLTDEPVSL